MFLLTMKIPILTYYVDVDDQTSGIQAFNPDPREELREGHLELINNGEVFSLEDEDDN